MKLTIKDGRDHFYTFDTNRILLLTATDEENIRQVEFSTEENGEEVSWTSEVLTGSDGVKYVQVPNEFLNGNYSRLVCYYVALDSNGEYTRQKEIFRIRARQEPQDYYLTYSERVTFASIKALTEQYKATTKQYMDTTEGFKDNAGRSAELASKYAENNEDVAVEPGKYSAKHWSIKAEAAKETAVQKATEAGTSEVNSKTYMESAQSAKQDAETAKNAANTILEQVQSKGTEITNFVATSKTEIETQKNESVNAVKSVYQTDLNELKGDLVELSNTIYPIRKSGIGTFALYWKYTEIINDIKLYKDKTYKIRCICNPAPTQSAYLVLSNSDNFSKSYQLQNESDITFYLTMTEDAENIKASIGSDTHVGTCEVIIEELYNNIEKNEKRIIDIEDGYRHFEKAFVVGERYNSIDTSVKTKVSMATNAQFDYDILVKVNDGYNALIVYYDETGSYMKTSGWFHYPDTKTVEANSIFGIQIVKYPTSEIVTDIDLYKNQVSYSTKIETKILDLEYNANSRIHNSNLYHILCRDKYLHHIDVDYYNGLIIPSQSIFDIRRAKRLGFNIIELNVQTTSDGVFYVGHGRAGCFGDAYYSVDGTDLTDVLISSVTSEYIQQNVRYKSKYDKYKVALTTLRDALIECKLNNLIPLIGYKDGVIEFTEKIMGKDNFLVGLYGNDRGTKTDAICFSWLTGDYNSVIQKANKSKGAYVCGINPTDSMYVDYTQEDWNTFVEKIHEAGYFVNTCYETKQQLQMFLKAGFDIISSRYCINDIEHGNLCNLESDLTFEDFNTDGTVSNGVLTLNTNQTLSPKETIKNVFLGGGSLRIIFSGKILVKLGQINEEYESDGKKELWFSSFIQENSPTFTITAIENTDILEISYKASKM